MAVKIILTAIIYLKWTQHYLNIVILLNLKSIYSGNIILEYNCLLTILKRK